jgi:hypothetical protein
MTPDYAAVLTAIRPGAQWTLEGDDYAGLTWLDDSPKPTKKTLDDAWPDVAYQRQVDQVDAARRARYQAESDGLFWEAWANANPGGQPDLAAWRAARATIKTDLPKPERP